MSLLDELQRRTKCPEAERPLTIVCLGDSVTHGCFELFIKGNQQLECVYDMKAVYHEQLKRKLSIIFPNISVNMINAGISGENAVGGERRIDRDVLSYHPDMAIVFLGLNDAGRGQNGIEEYKTYMEKILKKLVSNQIPCVLITPNMFATELDENINNEEIKKTALNLINIQNSGIMDLYVNEMRGIAEQLGVPVCDYYKKWKIMEKNGADITRLLANRINHPIREMHELLAYQLLDMIFQKQI